MKKRDLQEQFDRVADLAQALHPDLFCQAVSGTNGAPAEIWLTGPAGEDLRRELARLDPPVRLVEDAPYSEARIEQLVHDAAEALDVAVPPEGVSSVVGYTVETDTVAISVGGP